MDLKDKVVLISGSSNGIGKESAILFAKEGADVIITYNLDKKGALNTKEKCEGYGAQTLVLHLDIRDNNSIIDALKKVKRMFSHINILINNAGVISWKMLTEQSLEEIDDQVDTNLLGLIKLTKEFLPLIDDKIINIASGAGKIGFPGLSTYSATKFGVRGFSEALNRELEAIDVYSINPGMTKTRMTGYRGDDVENVSQVILDCAKDKYKEKGFDIDVKDA